jgi:DNA repair exonuclease SbcCD ATPase subunit
MDDITNVLVDQHIKEYEARLQRIDNLLSQAQGKLPQGRAQDETGRQLQRLKDERDKLAGWLEQARGKRLANWRQDEIRQAGPMGIWDAVAQQIEKLVERMER